MSTVASPHQEKAPAIAGVPKGWVRARVEDILVQGSPVVYGILQPGPDTPGGVPYIRPTEIDRDVIQVEELRRTVPAIAARYKRSEVRSGDVILTIVGTIGKVAVVPNGLDGANITQSSCRLRADGRVLGSQYLAWAMRSPALRAQFDKLRLGTAVPRLNIAHVRGLLVPIAPIQAQRRIVAKIEELFSDLDAGVAALERVRANLKRYRAAVLKAAVEGHLTEEWRKQHTPPHTEPAVKLLERILAERRAKWEQDQLRKFKEAGKTPPKGWREKYVGPRAPEVDALHELPTGWVWTTLDMIAENCGGITKGQKHSASTQLRDVPYLRVANVQRGYLDLSEIKTIPATDRDLEDLRLLPGDILFNEGGDRDKLGRGWVWNGEIPECIHQNHVFRARLFLTDVQPKFVSHHGNSFGQLWFLRTGKQSVNLASINLTVLRNFPVPLPPTAEQAEIVAEVDRRLSVADAAEQQVEHALQRAARLRQAILKLAFEGKLVPQDPTDESAAALPEPKRPVLRAQLALASDRKWRATP